VIAACWAQNYTTLFYVDKVITPFPFSQCYQQQNPYQKPPNCTFIQNESISGEILGTQRDVIIDCSEHGQVLYAVSPPLQVSSGTDGVCTCKFQYDGDDNSTTLDPTGLAGVDFSNGQVLAFDMDTDTAIPLTVTVYTDATKVSRFVYSMIQGPTIYIPFVSFIGNVEWNNIGAITFEFDATPALDFQLTGVRVLALEENTGDDPGDSGNQIPQTILILTAIFTCIGACLGVCVALTTILLTIRKYKHTRTKEKLLLRNSSLQTDKPLINLSK